MDEKRQRLGENIHRPGIESLASAIIIRACDDYRRALRYIYGCPHPRDERESNQKQAALGRARECERFFASEWFETLTAASPFSRRAWVEATGRRATFRAIGTCIRKWRNIRF